MKFKHEQDQKAVLAEACLKQIGFAPEGSPGPTLSPGYFSVGFSSTATINPVCGNATLTCLTYLFTTPSGTQCNDPADIYFRASKVISLGIPAPIVTDLTDSQFSPNGFRAEAIGYITSGPIILGGNDVDIWVIDEKNNLKNYKRSF